MTAPVPDQLRDRAASIRLLVLDVDGVLTDGRLYYGADGEALKSFDVKDGLGLRLLMNEGVGVAVISARGAPPLRARLAELSITHALLAREDKLSALTELLDVTGVALEEVAYVGDDIIDLPVLRVVGLPITVRDAHTLVRSEVAWVTSARGGRGAVREIADGLLAARGRLEASCNALLEAGPRGGGPGGG